jgi:hypothetical protein
MKPSRAFLVSLLLVTLVLLGVSFLFDFWYRDTEFWLLSLLAGLIRGFSFVFAGFFGAFLSVRIDGEWEARKKEDPDNLMNHY